MDIVDVLVKGEIDVHSLSIMRNVIGEVRNDGSYISVCALVEPVCGNGTLLVSGIVHEMVDHVKDQDVCYSVQVI